MAFVVTIKFMTVLSTCKNKVIDRSSYHRLYSGEATLASLDIQISHNGGHWTSHCRAVLLSIETVFVLYLK